MSGYGKRTLDLAAAAGADVKRAARALAEVEDIDSKIRALPRLPNTSTAALAQKLDVLTGQGRHAEAEGVAAELIARRETEQAARAVVEPLAQKRERLRVQAERAIDDAVRDGLRTLKRAIDCLLTERAAEYALRPLTIPEAFPRLADQHVGLANARPDVAAPGVLDGLPENLARAAAARWRSPRPMAAG